MRMRLFPILTIGIFCSFISACSAQQKQTSVSAPRPHFNHITVYVVDMDKSAAWYERVLQLERIDEPFHDEKHIWLRMGDHSQLHIVEGAKAVSDHDINIHLAFSVQDLDGFKKHLDSIGAPYGNWAQTSQDFQVRPDGIRQVYMKDPDGYWIEVNDDKF